MFTEIKMNEWKRRELFEHFSGPAGCSFNLTHHVDVTESVIFCKKNNISFYPVYLYTVTKAVNSIPDLLVATNSEGKLGAFNFYHPNYTLFNKETELFYDLWTEYNEDFSIFLKNYQEDQRQYGNSTKLSPKPQTPENILDISSLPWINYSSFDLNLDYESYLKPIITNGKYVEEDGKYLMPLSIRVNHKIADGYHASLFFDRVHKIQAEFK